MRIESEITGEISTHARPLWLTPRRVANILTRSLSIIFERLWRLKRSLTSGESQMLHTSSKRNKSNKKLEWEWVCMWLGYPSDIILVLQWVIKYLRGVVFKWTILIAAKNLIITDSFPIAAIGILRRRLKVKLLSHFICKSERYFSFFWCHRYLTSHLLH